MKKERIVKYIKVDKGLICPFCGSNNLSTHYNYYYSDNGRYYSDVDCNTCGEIWWKVYELTGISYLDHKANRYEYTVKPNVKSFISRLKKLIHPGFDFEKAHMEADGLLVDMLMELGYDEVVQEYIQVPKVYS